MKWIVRHPDKDTPKQRWCFVVLKPPADVFDEGEMKVLQWNGQWWSGTGDDLFSMIKMDQIMYWLEKEFPDKNNRI